ncbi:MAG: septation protein IspZ [Luminiphilus sp.]|nr:septation protein IspZ [Luminiphilus sp.]MDG2037654.1 septation protein IspZ [Luminiphilus sp.]
MRQLLEFLPLVLFFGAYQMDGDTVAISDWSYTFDGIFSATAVLMVSTVVVWLLCSALAKKNDRRMMWMAVAVVIFGAATLILRDQRFIQWKPTVFNWVLAAIFLGSQYVGERNLLQRLLGSQLSLTRKIWSRLNVLWISNFTVVGALNLFVAYQYEEAFWVSYKLYSSIGFTVVLMLLTIVIVAPHLKDQDTVDGDHEHAGGSQ